MAKGLLGGMTDYSHQSFSDILEDLKEEAVRTARFLKNIQSYIKKAEANEYWQTKVPVFFKNVVAYAIHHYETSIEEIEEIRKDITIEVKEHHVKRLNKIASVAEEINVDIGRIWHDKYENQEYGNKDFEYVERVYSLTRDMAVNLLDISNIAGRLNDFVGRDHELKERKRKFFLTIILPIILGVITITGFLFGTDVVSNFFKKKEKISASSPSTLSLTLVIFNGDNPIPKEQVILYDSLSKVSYKKSTDDDGTAIFTDLKKGGKYVYFFSYQDSTYRYNISIDGNEDITKKKVVSLKRVPNKETPLGTGNQQLFSSQGVKFKHNIIFDNINIRLNRFDLGQTAAYLQIGEQMEKGEGQILVQEAKIAHDNPFNFQFKGYNYVVYLVSISYGYPTDPTTPAAVIQLSKTPQ